MPPRQSASTHAGPTTAITRVAAPLRQELITKCRADILSQEYPPRTRLIERELCERYGVSRTVVREALRQLEAEGLVTIVPNRGPVVAVLSEEDAAAVFEVRAEMEALAARLFASRATDEQRAQLTAALEQVAAAFDDGDLEGSLAAKDEFYDRLLEGAHNAVVRSTLITLQARVQLLRGLSLGAKGRYAESLAEVSEIVKHAVAGDGRRAAKAARRHVERAGAAALAQLTERTAAEQKAKEATGRPAGTSPVSPVSRRTTGKRAAARSRT